MTSPVRLGRHTTWHGASTGSCGTDVGFRGRTPDSVELAPAFHLSEQVDDGLLHSGERLRREFVLGCPRVELDHRFVPPDRPGLACPAQRTEYLAAKGLEKDGSSLFCVGKVIDGEVFGG
jgi:hypothetical protein